MGEQWIAVPGTARRYAVSDAGRVKSFAVHREGRLLSPTSNKDGYLKIDLRPKGAPVMRCLVHRLVLQSFTGQRGEGLDACHLNHDRTDNRLANLKWGTRKENRRQSMSDGRLPRGVTHWQAKLDPKKVEWIRTCGLPNAEMARRLGVGIRAVHGAKTGRTWKHVPPAVSGGGEP